MHQIAFLTVTKQYVLIIKHRNRKKNHRCIARATCCGFRAKLYTTIHNFQLGQAYILKTDIRIPKRLLTLDEGNKNGACPATDFQPKRSNFEP